MKTCRIGILGLGGTGGFFGGKLAKFYSDYDDVEIVFIARGKNKEAILKNGLKVESVEGDFSVKPNVVSDDLNQIGVLDILLVCVKSYSLETAVGRYSKNVRKNGVVITIQNLVNQAERVERYLREGVYLYEGCAYIISNIAGPGLIRHRGGPASIFFGGKNGAELFEWVEKLFVKAGIKATLSGNISEIIWKKFLFISPLAVATSYFECTIGELRKDTLKLSFLRGLMEELFRIIETKGIGLKRAEIENHLDVLKSFPEDGKTSLQLDLENKGPSEIDSLIEYVCEEASRLKLPLRYYSLALERLKS